MARKVVIIGAGPGGYVAAIRAAQLGADVTIIEQEGIGGTCLNWGCIPTKVMVRAAEVLGLCRAAKDLGLRFSGTVAPDITGLMKRKEQVIRNQSEGIQRLLHHFKIKCLRGKGFIRGPEVVDVTMEDGNQADVRWDRLILAPGSNPLNLPSLTFDHEKVWSSQDALHFEDIPRSILIVGGGVIGCEFAFIFAAFGSQVTILEALPNVLPIPALDHDMAKVIQREMKKRKIRFLVNHTVKGYEETANGLRVETALFPQTEKRKEADGPRIETEKVLVCIGRRPATNDMGLENVGVHLDQNGWIHVNDRMETSVPHVYAAGDVLGPPRVMLAHVASSEGRVAAENAMGGSAHMNYHVIPGAIFTVPEVGYVGLTEKQAFEEGYSVQSESVLFRNLGKPHVMGEITGQAKIVWNNSDGKLLGIHMVGPHATELIAEGALAIQAGLTVKALAQTIHAHPTLSEIMAEVSCKALGQALHG